MGWSHLSSSPFPDVGSPELGFFKLIILTSFKGGKAWENKEILKLHLSTKISISMENISLKKCPKTNNSP